MLQLEQEEKLSAGKDQTNAWNEPLKRTIGQIQLNAEFPTMFPSVWQILFLLRFLQDDDLKMPEIRGFGW